MAKAFFFDRDGVVNQVPQNGKRYIETWEEFFLMPGFVDVMRRVSDAGFISVVITNQRGVGQSGSPRYKSCKGQLTDNARLSNKVHPAA